MSRRRRKHKDEGTATAKPGRGGHPIGRYAVSRVKDGMHKDRRKDKFGRWV